MPERANLPSTLKQDFDRDGFVSIPGFFSTEELAKVEQRLKRYVDEVVPGLPQNDAYYEVKGPTRDPQADASHDAKRFVV